MFGNSTGVIFTLPLPIPHSPRKARRLSLTPCQEFFADLWLPTRKEEIRLADFGRGKKDIARWAISDFPEKLGEQSSNLDCYQRMVDKGLLPAGSRYKNEQMSRKDSRKVTQGVVGNCYRRFAGKGLLN